MVRQTNESSKTFREQQDILQQESSRAIITQVDDDKVSLSSKRLSRKKNTPAETRASLDDAQSLSSSTNLSTNSENARNQRTPIVLRPKSASGNVLGKLYWWRTHALSLELDNALLKKDAAAVRKALERGARVNKTISLSENPTAYVCRQGNAEILEALLQYGADPDVPCGLIVAEHGFVECLVVLYSRRTWVSADLARIFDHALACGQSGVMDYLASRKTTPCFAISSPRRLNYTKMMIYRPSKPSLASNRSSILLNSELMSTATLLFYRQPLSRTKLTSSRFCFATRPHLDRYFTKVIKTFCPWLHQTVRSQNCSWTMDLIQISDQEISEHQYIKLHAMEIQV